MLKELEWLTAQDKLIQRIRTLRKVGTPGSQIHAEKVENILNYLQKFAGEISNNSHEKDQEFLKFVTKLANTIESVDHREMPIGDLQKLQDKCKVMAQEKLSPTQYHFLESSPILMHTDIGARVDAIRNAMLSDPNAELKKVINDVNKASRVMQEVHHDIRTRKPVTPINKLSKNIKKHISGIKDRIKECLRKVKPTRKKATQNNNPKSRTR